MYIFTNKYKTQNFKGKGKSYSTIYYAPSKKKKNLYQPKKNNQQFFTIYTLDIGLYYNTFGCIIILLDYFV